MTIESVLGEHLLSEIWSFDWNFRIFYSCQLRVADRQLQSSYLVYDITLCECFCLLLSNKKSRWFFCSVTSNQTYPLVSSHNQRRRRLWKFVWDKLFKRKLLKVCRYSVSKNVLIFHCLNKLFWLSQKFWKLSAFSFHIFKVFLYHHNIFFTVVQNNFWNKIPSY